MADIGLSRELLEELQSISTIDAHEHLLQEGFRVEKQIDCMTHSAWMPEKTGDTMVHSLPAAFGEVERGADMLVDAHALGA